MKPAISIVTLGVADYGRSKAFYEALGWSTELDFQETAFLQANGVLLVLWARDKLAADTGAKDDGARWSGITLGHNVASRGEVDAVLEQARNAGARIVRPAHDTFWGGYAGYFQDPDGHLWEVAWNPQLPIED